MRRFEPCYMCKNIATSREHVPPKSFFPYGNRHDLITVPSCDLHNLEKSGNDEYLRSVITSAFTGNDTARTEVWPKVVTSIKKAPLKGNFFRNLRPVVLSGVETGMFDVNMPRLQDALGCIFRGLYRHHFGYAWLEPLSILPSGHVLFALSNVAESETRRLFFKKFDLHFGAVSKHGANADVFYYQLIGDSKSCVMKLMFYGGTDFMGLFNMKDVREFLDQLNRPEGKIDPGFWTRYVRQNLPASRSVEKQ